MKVATWNIKQIAPRKPLVDRVKWLDNKVDADIAVLTEADLKVATDFADRAVAGRPEGLGNKQKFSTFVVSTRLQLAPIHTVGRMRKHQLDTWYPGTLVAVDVLERGQRWGTLVGVYGVTRDPDGTSHGHGLYSTEALLDDITRIVKYRDRVVVAGDLNIHPRDAGPLMAEAGLVDLIEETSATRSPLKGCVNCTKGKACGHLWTHKNGRADGNGRPQQIDYIFSTPDLLGELSSVYGGTGHFRSALTYSDHAPVVAEFSP